MIDPWKHCVECDLCGELYCEKCDTHYFECDCPGLLELLDETIEEKPEDELDHD